MPADQDADVQGPWLSQMGTSQQNEEQTKLRYEFQRESDCQDNTG